MDCQVRDGAPFCGTTRRTSPHHASLYWLLRRHQNTSVIGQGCATLAPRSADRNHKFTPGPWRTSSPLCPGLCFRYTQRAMGIRDHPISPGLPWQNGIAERLIGTVRRKCLDRMIIFGESHLRRILSAYAAYYNRARTYLALHLLGITERCTLASSGPTVWYHCRYSHLGRAASTIRSDVIFGRDRG